MKMVIKVPTDYVGILMANPRAKSLAMDRTIRQAIIDGTPLPDGDGRLKFSLKDGRWRYEICGEENEGSGEEIQRWSFKS